MFTSFKEFTKKIYDKQSDGMKKIYGSEAKHRASYLANTGFSEWIETLRGETLNMSQMKSVAETYHTFGKRSVEDVVSALAYLARQYEVEYPVKEGILTKEYWENHFSAGAEMTP